MYTYPNIYRIHFLFITIYLQTLDFTFHLSLVTDLFKCPKFTLIDNGALKCDSLKSAYVVLPLLEGEKSETFTSIINKKNKYERELFS